MRLLLAGGRHRCDAALVRAALDRVRAAHPLTVLIHGGLPGIGCAAEDWARDHRLHVIRYPANWRAFGRRAEGIRNAFMLDDARPDLVLALPGGADTRALLRRAEAAGLPVIDLGALGGADPPGASPCRPPPPVICPPPRDATRA